MAVSFEKTMIWMALLMFKLDSTTSVSVLDRWIILGRVTGAVRKVPWIKRGAQLFLSYVRGSRWRLCIVLWEEAEKRVRAEPGKRRGFQNPIRYCDQTRPRELDCQQYSIYVHERPYDVFYKYLLHDRFGEL